MRNLLVAGLLLMGVSGVAMAGGDEVVLPVVEPTPAPVVKEEKTVMRCAGAVRNPRYMESSNPSLYWKANGGAPVTETPTIRCVNDWQDNDDDSNDSGRDSSRGYAH